MPEHRSAVTLFRLALLFSLLGISAACRESKTLPGVSPVPETTPTPNTSKEILADAFFFGCAYLDGNGNGLIDEGDEPLPGAVFLVRLPIGGMTARTGTDGCATLVIPGGVDRSAWPVETDMDPPPDSGLVLITPSPLVLEYQHSHADFLFESSANQP